MPCGPTAYTVSTVWSFCWHHYSRQHRFLEVILAITRDQELGHLHVEMEPFTFRASVPCLELRDTLLLGVCDEYWSSVQRSFHGIPVWNPRASASSTRMNKTKDRALMHTYFHSKLAHCIDHWPAHDVGPCSLCPGWHAQPIPWTQISLRPTIGPPSALDGFRKV